MNSRSIKLKKQNQSIVTISNAHKNTAIGFSGDLGVVDSITFKANPKSKNRQTVTPFTITPMNEPDVRSSHISHNKVKGNVQFRPKK